MLTQVPTMAKAQQRIPAIPRHLMILKTMLRVSTKLNKLAQSCSRRYLTKLRRVIVMTHRVQQMV